MKLPAIFLALAAVLSLGCLAPLPVVGPRPPVTATPDSIAVALDEVVLPALYVANGLDAILLTVRTKDMSLTQRLDEQDRFHERWEVIWGEDEQSGLYGTLVVAVSAWRAAVDASQPDTVRIAETAKAARGAFCKLRSTVTRAAPEAGLPDLPFAPCP